MVKELLLPQRAGEPAAIQELVQVVREIQAAADAK